MNRLFHAELELPIRGKSQRVTRRPNVVPGETIVLFDEEGPGCIHHWWLTYGYKRESDVRDPIHDLQFCLYCDGGDDPVVDLPLARFFAILFEHDIYPVDSAAIKILPKNALNCYLPIPFKSLRLEITNNSDRAIPLWFMADWASYDNTELTPLRLHVTHRGEYPAQSLGSMLMADYSGSGFIAGMVKGVVVRDRADAWYHTGGDLWLLDGESDPHALRGIGGEDIFNMSFGIWKVQTDWVGAPHIHRSTEHTAGGSGYEGVMYRFFGPDPIWFDHSAIIRFGSRENDLESVIYAYVNPAEPPPILTLAQWEIAGPFPCNTREDFNRSEWAEKSITDWPNVHTADFDIYMSENAPATFSLPIQADSERGWCDFTRYLRGRKRTNVGTQPANVSAYAVGQITMPEAGAYTLAVGYDDWIRVWVNGKEIHTGEHDNGFAIDHIPCELPAGPSEIRIKLSNFDNAQWRLWTFHAALQKA